MIGKKHELMVEGDSKGKGQQPYDSGLSIPLLSSLPSLSWLEVEAKKG